MDAITYTSIGVIHSPFTETAGMPLQAVAAAGVAGTIELEPAYAAGLRDLEGVSHLFLLYHLHRIEGFALEVTPFRVEQTQGIFATRSPKRPNATGLSVVRLVSVAGCTLAIEDVDVLDGTPVLDIKPYVPAFDVRETERIGWLATTVARVHEVRADRRFG